MTNSNKKSQNHRSAGIRRFAGFTLIEFMAAMGIFMIVGGAAFMLFRQDVPLFNQQQNLAGLNISVQNAVTQIQQDVVNAGTGFYSGTNLPELAGRRHYCEYRLFRWIALPRRELHLQRYMF